MVKVITTNFGPERPIEVDELEEADLRAQGLLLGDDKKTTKKKEA